MTYNKELANADSIEVQTYYKPCCTIGINIVLQNVYVNSINVGANTVNAKIGANGTVTDFPKAALFEYINFSCYSDG